MQSQSIRQHARDDCTHMHSLWTLRGLFRNSQFAFRSSKLELATCNLQLPRSKIEDPRSEIQVPRSNSTAAHETFHLCVCFGRACRRAISAFASSFRNAVSIRYLTDPNLCGNSLVSLRCVSFRFGPRISQMLSLIILAAKLRLAFLRPTATLRPFKLH